VNCGQGPGSYDIVALLPGLGNGFGMHWSTGRLYAATEGNFLPGTGRVFEIDPSNGFSVSILKDEMWAADGLFIDQLRHILYVGELFTGKVWAYDLAARAEIGWLDGLGGPGLDDFCLNLDGTSFFGCQWFSGEIDVFPVNASSPSPSVYVASLNNPTSVRWGVGPGFSNTSLFVTEGGGVFPFETNFRVLELSNADEWLQLSLDSRLDRRNIMSRRNGEGMFPADLLRLKRRLALD